MKMVTVLGSPRRMLIASAALVAIAVTVLGQLLVQDAGATSIEMTVACANNSSGVMRYITPGQQCASG